MMIEVAYATPEKQVIVSVNLKPDAMVRDAIYLSGILNQFPEINLDEQIVGVFSEKVSLSDRLNPGDRIEIYRPLTIDPKEARRLRAKRKKS